MRATPEQNKEAMIKLRLVMSNKKEAQHDPKIMARKVKEVMIPLAFEIFSLETISGRIPYFEGPKIALCVASRKRMIYDPILLWYAKAKTPKSIVTSSKILVAKIIFLLLNRSAKVPEEAEKNKKGSTKIAPVIANMLWLSSIPSNSMN